MGTSSLVEIMVVAPARWIPPGVADMAMVDGPRRRSCVSMAGCAWIDGSHPM